MGVAHDCDRRAEGEKWQPNKETSLTNESSIYRLSPGGPGRRVDLGAYAADDGRGPLRAHGDRERALRAELVGDDQRLLLRVRCLDVRARDDVVPVHRDRGVRPG